MPSWAAMPTWVDTGRLSTAQHVESFDESVLEKT